MLTKPSTSTLKVRDNGYRVKKVTNLRTGAAIAFSQGGGTLTLTGVSGWDQYDTVFKVETAGRAGVYDPATVTEKANGQSAPAIGDGNYLSFWRKNKTLPVNVDFDLGSAKKVQYVGINQREDSVSYAKSDTEQSSRIKGYKVYVSSDGQNWGSAVKTGQLASHRGVAFLDLTSVTSRYVRVQVTSTWSASSDTKHYKKLGIDEAWIGSSYATAAS